MPTTEFEDGDFIIPASGGVRVFENDLGGVSIAELTGTPPAIVGLSVHEARLAAEEMLRLCKRIEVGRAAYARACEREILNERRQRARNP